MKTERKKGRNKERKKETTNERTKERTNELKNRESEPQSQLLMFWVVSIGTTAQMKEFWNAFTAIENIAA